MKKIILITITLLSLTVLAADNNEIEGTVVDVVCSEMDPFAVGDACVVFAEVDATGAKRGLVYNDYDWSFLHVAEPDSATDTVGDQFIAAGCEKIYDMSVVNVLKDYNSSYFYLSCDVSSFSWK